MMALMSQKSASANNPLPSTEEIVRRILACRDEMKALKRLLAMCRAAEEADRARQARTKPERAVRRGVPCAG
jgi:hypothetical protein